MRVAVVVFPGSNADWDALHAVRDVLGADARYVFHKETSLGDADAVVVPGGFSYGDYLRAGAIARFSPIAPAIERFAKGGGPVLGICNGFQVLTEMGLLPGGLARNAHLRFECRDVWVRVEGGGPFTHQLAQGSVLRLPIAHAEGRYVCDPETLARLEAEEQVAFRYCAPDGEVHAEANPNGSVASIAGVYNEARNVLGLMPHPERAAEAVLGNEDGLSLFRCLASFLEEAA
ncbi:MAG: phosphoribosylformylglycinamidine synthase subunit PurQ [Sandaracinaceae bacterium]|nr:phosphoribosylformylglycinamidine synthase subunit PurQ [Sandaracinaceae bacterium]